MIKEMLEIEMKLFAHKDFAKFCVATIANVSNCSPAGPHTNRASHPVFSSSTSSLSPVVAVCRRSSPNPLKVSHFTTQRCWS